jgi:hypothetical protein
VSQPYALVVKVVAENQDGSMSPAYGGTAVIYDAAGNQVGSRVGLQPDGTALLPDLVSPDTGPVEARYTGGAGLQPSVSTRFTATADNPDIIPPLVKLTGPYTGSVVKGDLVIKAQVSDNDQVSRLTLWSSPHQVAPWTARRYPSSHLSPRATRPGSIPAPCLTEATSSSWSPPTRPTTRPRHRS